jgi:hypothetical protein
MASACSAATRSSSTPCPGSPGQPWLWLYQLWYHVPGWESSTNVDLIAIYMTGLGTLLLLLVPSMQPLDVYFYLTLR